MEKVIHLMVESGYPEHHLMRLVGGRMTPEEIEAHNKKLQEAFEARKRAPAVLTPEQLKQKNDAYNKEIEDDSRKDWTSYHFTPKINPETGEQETIEEQEIRIRTGSDQGRFAPRFYEDGTRETLSDRQTRINETIEQNAKNKAEAEYIKAHPYYWRGEWHDKPEGFWSSFGHVFTDQITDPNSLIRGSILPIASTVLGSIPVIGTAVKGLNYANEGAKMLGYGTGTHRENFLRANKLEDRHYSLKELSKISSVPYATLSEVMKRASGAYTTQPNSVRLKGSFVKGVKAPMRKKLSKRQWQFARVYSFLDGNPKHDNDLRKRPVR